MKKITLILLLLISATFSWQSNAQIVTEDFEAGFVSFSNAVGNGTDFSLETTFFQQGLQSARNVYANSQTNILEQSSTMDLSGTAGPLLQFWHIAKTEGNYDKCYVEISTDGGTSYTALTSAEYLGDSSQYTSSDSYFDEDAYADWGTSDTTPDNSWFKKEVFDLSNYKVANVKIRFRLTSDGSIMRSGGWIIDNVKVLDPTCVPVSDIQVSAITQTEATISWTENNLTPATEWEYVIQPVGTGEPTVAGTSTMSNPVTDTTLAASTNYEVYVRSICSATDASEWFGPVTFVTACAPFGDFTENFDATADGDLTICWASKVTTTDALAGVSVQGGAVQFSNAADTSAELILVTPELTDLPNDTHRIRFTASGPTGSALQIGTMDSPTGTFTPVFGYALSTTDTEYAYSFSASTTDLFVALKAVLPAANNSIMLDDFNWEPTPSCIEPGGLLVNAETTDGATISWTDNNSPAATTWDVYVVAQGSPAPDAATVPTLDNEGATTTVYTAGASATVYDVYVRTDCGADNTDVSTWTGPVSFATLCPIMTVPYTETFNSDSSTQQCWSVLDENADNDLWNMDYTSNTYEGDEVAMMYTDLNSGDNDDWLISPQITLTGNERLVYQYRVQSSGEPNDFELVLSTTGNTPADFTNELIATTSYSNTSYIEQVVDLSAYTGDVYVAWHVPAGGLDGWRLFIDNVVFEEIPTCFVPSGLAVDSVTQTGATFTWTENNGTPATNWDLYIVPAGDAAPDAVSTPTLDNETTQSVVWAGGAAASSYDVYVRSDCDGANNNTDVSVWVGPETFYTLCDVFMAPYTEDFEDGGNVDQCWIQDANDNFDWSAHMGATVSSSTGPTAANGGDYYIYTETSSPVGNSDVAIIYSPQIDLSALTVPMLKFAYHMYGAGMDTDGAITVEISTDGGANYTEVFNETGNHGDQWNLAEIALTSYTGVATFKISGIVGSTGTSYENDFAIDDFIIEETPTCIRPANIVVSDITAMGATFAWDEQNATLATNWDLYIVPAGDAAPDAATAPTLDDEQDNTATIWAAGTEQTAYDVYVRADCDADNVGVSIWEGPISFTTIANCIVPSDLMIANIDSAASTADFSWADTNATAPANGWEYELVHVTAGGTPIGTGVVVAASPVGLTGLVAGDDYQILVRAMCGATSSSDWSVAYSWTQVDIPGCVSNPSPADAAMIPLGLNTFTWDVPTGTVDSYDILAGTTMALELGVIANVTTNTVDLDIPVTGVTYYWQVVPKNGGGSPTGCPIWSFTAMAPGCGETFTDVNGAGADYAANENYTWTINPDVVGEVVTVTFTSFDTEAGYDKLKVYDGVDVNATLIGTYDGTTTPGPFVSSDASGALTFVFTSDSVIQKAGWEADITCGAPPVCNDPTNLSVSNLTDLAAELSWDENSTPPASSWDIEWGTSGFAQGAGTMVTGVTTNPYSLSGLTAETDYEFYVRSNCSVTYQSGWVGPFAFTTLATPSCLVPTNLTATAITNNSADLGWDEINTVPATEWDVEWGMSGFTQGSGTMVSGTMDNPYAIAAGDLTPETAYEFYVRTVCSATDSSTWAGPFAFTTLPTPPANNDCANAIPLTVGPDFATNMLTGTNIGATDSGELAPGCASYSGGDVWYSVVVPSDGILTLELNTAVGGITDGAAAAYSGTCGSFTLIDCDDSSSTDPEDQPLIEINDMTYAGQTIYLRVWEYGNDSFGEFNVSAYNPNIVATNDLQSVGFNYYPNPVNNSLTMTANENITSVSIFNMLGQEVKTEKLSTMQANIDMSRLASGTYFVKAQVGQTVGTFKIVKK